MIDNKTLNKIKKLAEGMENNENSLTVILRPHMRENSWHLKNYSDSVVVRCYGYNNDGLSKDAKQIAEYIYAINPKTLLEMIDEIQSTRKANKKKNNIMSNL